MEKAFGDKGRKYVLWAANMSVGLETGVPWVMCKQDDAPDPIVSVSCFFFFLQLNTLVTM